MNTQIPSTPPSLKETGWIKAKRNYFYPIRLPGKYAKERRIWAISLMAIYFILPWLSYNRHPILRFEFINGTIYFLGLVLRTTDVTYLVFLLLLSGVALFWVTAYFGRVFCSYACPQTVFLEWLVKPIEIFFEGNHADQKKLRDQPWNARKASIKIGKNLTIFVLSLVISHTLLIYFVPPETLFSWMHGAPSIHKPTFVVMVVLTALFFFDMAWFREQFCSFLCPYARFQSVLMDHYSRTALYDHKRGEPRGKKGEATGDCIDCGLCIKVCPTGIDIRNGPQLECIQCNRCIDACDDIMVKMNKPKGLIRYTSAVLAGFSAANYKFEWRRPRILIYATVALLAVTAFAYRWSNRQLVEMTFIREAKGNAYSRLPTGEIGNIYSVRAVNTTGEIQPIHLKVTNPSNAGMVCGACDQPLAPYEERKMGVVFFLNRDDDRSNYLEISYSEHGHTNLYFIHPQHNQGESKGN